MADPPLAFCMEGWMIAFTDRQYSIGGDIIVKLLNLRKTVADDLVDELNAIDMSNMTPLQALNKLQELKKKAEG